MHTSSGVDSVDEFEETIVRHGNRLLYRYGREERPVRVVTINLNVRQSDGRLAQRSFTTYATHHGPIVRAAGQRWIAMALMNRPIEALEQSWLRTKARDFGTFMAASSRQANSSNDTIYADADGHIAYLHPQFVPVRDNRFDYRDPVDGSDPATDWHGLTPLDRLPHVLDPRGHWLYNANDAPWRAAGDDSPRIMDFPRYMDQAGDSPRGDHAVALLGSARDLTPEGLRRIAYDPWMPFFDQAVPALARAYETEPIGDPPNLRTGQAIRLLGHWDRRWSADSEATTIASFWGEEL